MKKRLLCGAAAILLAGAFLTACDTNGKEPTESELSSTVTADQNHTSSENTSLFVVQPLSSTVDSSSSPGTSSKPENPATSKTSSASSRQPDSSREMASQAKAVQQAKAMLAEDPYSHDTMIQTLYRDYDISYEDGVYAANHCGADWNEQAVRAAKIYLRENDYGSARDLYGDLTSNWRFTDEQTSYGLKHCGANWKEPAANLAKHYASGKVSKDETLFWMEQSGYTDEEIDYAMKQAFH